MEESNAASNARPHRSHLASAHAVRLVLARLRSLLPHIVPAAEPEILYFLHCLGRVARSTESDAIPRNIGPWKAVDLLRVGEALRELLGVDGSRYGVTLEAFIERYLEILLLPDDVEKLLESGSLSLEEAEEYGRLTAARLGLDAEEAARERTRAYLDHRDADGDLDALRRTVGARLRAAERARGRPSEPHWPAYDDGLPCFGSRHLFWEQLTLLRFAFQEIGSEVLTDRDVAELVEASDHVWAVLLGIWRRRRVVDLERKYNAMARGISEEEPADVIADDFGE